MVLSIHFLIFKTNPRFCIYYEILLPLSLTSRLSLSASLPALKCCYQSYHKFTFGLFLHFFSMRLMTCSVSFQTETALIYDAVHLFAQALHDLDHSQEINTSPLSCDGSETWQHGNSLVNYMKLVNIDFYIFDI